MQVTSQDMQPVLERAEAEAEEIQAAEALLLAALEIVRPGLRALCARRRDESRDGLAVGGGLELTGPGIAYHAKGQYATTGSVGGWGYVLTPGGQLVRRTYSGTHSDFPQYERIRNDDQSATARQVVSWSTGGATSDVAGCLQALARRCRIVGDARQIRAARDRTAKLQQALAALR